VLGVLQLIDTLPRLVFIILVCTIMNPAIYLIALVAAVLFIPAIATVIRRRVEALGSEDYILAHVAHGFRPIRILLYHILWLQCRPLLIRQATYVFVYVLFVETALSYLGDYGVQEPSPSWGNMVAQTRELGGASFWPWLFPAVAIVLTISAFMAFGNLLARRDEAEVR
jgi:peptide/nickel transport system permease protein